MAKRKKGSKTVPKGKAPLGELSLPYEVRSGSYTYRQAFPAQAIK